MHVAGSSSFQWTSRRWRLFSKVKITAKRFSFSIWLGLFALRAAKRGELQRWVKGIATLSEVLFGLAVFADLEFILHVGTWVLQLLRIYVDFSFALLDFAAQVLHISLYVGVYQRVLYGAQPRVEIMDWIAAVIVQLWYLRIAYAIFGVRILRWRSRRLLETALQHSLKQPFHAEFDTHFVEEENNSQPSALPDATPPTPEIPRSFSGIFLETSAISPIRVVGLREKHALLLESRAALLEDEDLDDYDGCLVEKWTVNVRRSHILEDSLNALLEASTIELLSPGLTVNYVGENGIDYGGLALDWFDEMGQALSKGADDDDGDSLLFLGKSSRMLIPRPGKRTGSDDAENTEDRFRKLLLTGRFLALAVVFGGRPLPFPLSPFVCKYILGSPIDKSDMERLDPDFYRERVVPLLRKGGLAQLNADLGEPLTFVSVPTQLRPEPEELEPGGANMIVTESNLEHYLQLLCDAFLCGELRQELQCLLRGFWDVLPVETMRSSGLTTSELEAMVAGTQGIDVNEWQQLSKERHGSQDLTDDDNDAFTDTHLDNDGLHQVFSWFWTIVRELDEEQRRLLLRFVTGSGRLPPGGFASLSPPFTLTLSETVSSDHLPHANTCINRLVLYQYASPQQLRSKLLQALPTGGFGFA